MTGSLTSKGAWSKYHANDDEERVGCSSAVSWARKEDICFRECRCSGNTTLRTGHEQKSAVMASASNPNPGSGQELGHASRPCTKSPSL